MRDKFALTDHLGFPRESFVAGGWITQGEMSAEVAAARTGQREPPAQPSELNGASDVHCLQLTTVIEGCMPRGQSLALMTLLAEDPLDDRLLKEFAELEPPRMAAYLLRTECTATRVAFDGQLQTLAQLAMQPAQRAAVERARSAQLLDALCCCFEDGWAGGVLFLARFAAPLCDAALRAALDAFALTLLSARDGAEHATPPGPLPPLPPLPEAQCAFCLTPCGAGQRKLCSGCRAVCYHSVECQRSHWPTHKSGAFGVHALRACMALLLTAPCARTVHAAGDEPRDYWEVVVQM